MGIRDYFTPDAICLVEWPEKGYGMLPEADLDIDIRYQDDHRIVSLTANSEYGQRLLCLLYTSPSPRDLDLSRMPSSA